MSSVPPPESSPPAAAPSSAAAPPLPTRIPATTGELWVSALVAFPFLSLLPWPVVWVLELPMPAGSQAFFGEIWALSGLLSVLLTARGLRGAPQVSPGLRAAMLAGSFVMPIMFAWVFAALFLLLAALTFGGTLDGID